MWSRLRWALVKAEGHDEIRVISRLEIHHVRRRRPALGTAEASADHALYLPVWRRGCHGGGGSRVGRGGGERAIAVGGAETSNQKGDVTRSIALLAVGPPQVGSALGWLQGEEV